MQRTIKLTLPSNDLLLKTIKLYNAVCNEVLKVGFEAKTYSKDRIHRLAYYGIRKRHPMLQLSRFNVYVIKLVTCLSERN